LIHLSVSSSFGVYWRWGSHALISNRLWTKARAKQRSLSWHSSLADSGHGVMLIVIALLHDSNIIVKNSTTEYTSAFFLNFTKNSLAGTVPQIYNWIPKKLKSSDQPWNLKLLFLYSKC
jgi:hypothetical protein